ncbi:MAG: T9SS type A sorting domain-containing protein [Cyclobacteriaceae bacterium]|nr:T9SS type A sorting domain-containing protein [Cyclobacteriaceae bacterium]
MKKIVLQGMLYLFSTVACSQDYTNVDIDSEVTDVQPMTGMVFWPGNNDIETDAIALEFSYMDFSQIVLAQSEYDWTVVDNLLDEMASRNHQAVLRFRFTYVGKTTTVPQYIKDLPDYHETEALSEGMTTWFPDWTNAELKRFTLEFYEKFAERYDNDPRLAFLQVGFGLWAEYHIYDGPFELGVTFPDKEFQKEFFAKLDSVFTNTFWSISIDAADGTYSPFSAEPDLKNLTFGLFDDSFMHGSHSGYNTDCWNFFGRDRYKEAPAGGEFSYYSDYDQQNILNPVVGAYGKPYEIYAQDFHITYINANDQNRYHSLKRIKEASMNSGYKFKLNSVKTKPGSTVIEIVNLGVAPIYTNAYLAVNGVRSTESLKLLAPDEPVSITIPEGGDNIAVTIESDDILSTETIEYFGTVNDYERYVQPEEQVLGFESKKTSLFTVYPTVVDQGGVVKVDYKGKEEYSIKIYDQLGKVVYSKKSSTHSFINTANYVSGLYYMVVNNPLVNTVDTVKFVVE